MKRSERVRRRACVAWARAVIVWVLTVGMLTMALLLPMESGEGMGSLALPVAFLMGIVGLCRVVSDVADGMRLWRQSVIDRKWETGWCRWNAS